MATRSRFDLTDAVLWIGALVLFYILVQNTSAQEVRAHTNLGAMERNINYSELFITIPDGEIRLVFWHHEEGAINSERDAYAIVLSNKWMRQATKTEVKMFFELYDSKTIKKHAQLYARRGYSYEGRLVETLPKCFAVVYKPPWIGGKKGE